MFSRLFTRRRAGSVMTPVMCKDQRKARPLCYRPQLETLEERLLLANDDWTGLGANPFWSNPANWDNGVPNPGDDLVFSSDFSQSPINDLPAGTTFNSIIFGRSSPPPPGTMGQYPV